MQIRPVKFQTSIKTEIHLSFIVAGHCRVLQGVAEENQKDKESERQRQEEAEAVRERDRDRVIEAERDTGRQRELE